MSKELLSILEKKVNIPLKGTTNQKIIQALVEILNQTSTIDKNLNKDFKAFLDAGANNDNR